MGLRSKLEDLERVGAPVRGGLVGAADAPELLAGAAYYGTVYPVSEAAGARTARPSVVGRAGTRAGVEPAGRSFFANLRQPRVSTLEGPVG